VSIAEGALMTSAVLTVLFLVRQRYDRLSETPGRKLGAVTVEVMADYLDINGSRQSKVQNLGDHVGRQKRKRYTRKVFGQARAKLFDIVVGRMVLR
jgi:hypothetical protein